MPAHSSSVSQGVSRVCDEAPFFCDAALRNGKAVFLAYEFKGDEPIAFARAFNWREASDNPEKVIGQLVREATTFFAEQGC